MRKFYRSLIAATFSLAAFVSPVAAQTANGKATTAAPVYPNNQAAPLSLDTAGNLRVNCIIGCSGGGGGGTSSNFGAAFPAAGTASGFLDPSNNMIGASVDALGNQQVVGNVANDAVDAGNPVKIGGIASNVAPSLVATGDRVNSWYGLSGATIIGGVGVTLADGSSNTTGAALSTAAGTTGTLSVRNNVFNGTSWDRQRGDVNETYVGGNINSGVTDVGNPVKVGGVYMTTAPTFTNGQRGNMLIDVGGRQIVQPGFLAQAQADGLNNTINAPTGALFSTSAVSNIQYPTVARVYNGATWDRQRGDVGGTWSSPSPTPLTSNFSAILANSTNATLVKNAPGAIQEISVYNSGSTIAWLKLYDAASAPTCGSGTPAGRYMIPGAASGGAGSNVNIALGKGFSTGIAFCVTTGIADADTGAVAATTYTVNMTYR